MPHTHHHHSSCHNLSSQLSTEHTSSPSPPCSTVIDVHPALDLQVPTLTLSPTPVFHLATPTSSRQNSRTSHKSEPVDHVDLHLDVKSVESVQSVGSRLTENEQPVAQRQPQIKILPIKPSTAFEITNVNATPVLFPWYINVIRPNLLILYGILTWYSIIMLYIITTVGIDSKVWVTALFASIIVGCALNGNAWDSNHETIVGYARRSPFGILRFFLIPFGVSSYSSTASKNPTMFWYLFPSKVDLLLPALAAMIVQMVVLYLIWKLMKEKYVVQAQAK